MNKIKKLWGIGLVIMLLASLIIVPASTASAGTLVWSAAGMPNTPATMNQIKAADADSVTVAPNGDIYVVDTQAAPDIIYKSTNNGVSWTASVITAMAAAGDVIVDLVVSPNYAADSTVLAVAKTVASNTICLISSNAGATFVQLGGTIGAAADVPTSIDVEPSYTNGNGQIMVSTRAGANGLYIWGAAGVLNWVGQTPLAANVYKAAFSPLYPIDATIFAVVDTGAAIQLHAKTSTNAWNAGLTGYPAVLQAATGLVTADIAFPSDFNASIAASRTLFVGLNTATVAADDVARVTSTTLGTTVQNLGIGATVSVYSVDYVGTYASGTLYAGASNTSAIYRCANANATVGWVFLPQDTTIAGGAGITKVSLAAVGTTIYVGNSGAAANDESAFYISEDAGVNFYATGLIDTTITTLADLDVVSATEMFLVTTNGVSGTDSLWKSIDGGVTWLRIYTIAPAGVGLPVCTVSADYANDQTLYFGSQDFTAPGVATIIQMSKDGGATWNPRAYPAAAAGSIGAIYAVDEYTLYVADATANAIYKSVNNGWTWTTGTVVGGGAGYYQIKYDAGTGALLAGDVAGGVAISTDGTNWTDLGNAGVSTGNMVVAFDADYANNSVVYAGDSSLTGVGIYRCDTSVTPYAWMQLDNKTLAGNTQDIVVAPDGTLYYSDGAAVAAAAGGMYRVLDPTAFTPGTANSLNPASAIVNTMAGGALLAAPVAIPAAPTCTALQYAPGSNVIYAIDTANNVIFVFTDTLSDVVPPKAAPAADAIVVNTNINVIVEPVDGATGYQVQWGNRSDFRGGVAATENMNAFPTYNWVLNTTAPVPVATGVPAGSTIYYRVRVSTPYVGPWSETYTVETQLAAPVAPNAPAIIGTGAEGSTAAGGWGVSLSPTFYWGPIAGATAYEFQLSTDTAFSDLVVDATGADALAVVEAYQYTGMLEYDTAYFWRVRALSATSQTSWSAVQGFTTMEEVVAVPTATSTSTQPVVTPTFTVTQPAPTTIEVGGPVTNEVSPGYIWAIIIIGAVLVIAVIVLIVRTRRTV